MKSVRLNKFPLYKTFKINQIKFRYTEIYSKIKVVN